MYLDRGPIFELLFTGSLCNSYEKAAITFFTRNWFRLVPDGMAASSTSPGYKVRTDDTGCFVDAFFLLYYSC